MKKLLLTFCIYLPLEVFACSGYVIGIKGDRDIFDGSAFAEYASELNYCSKSFSWYQDKEIVKFANKLHLPYQLYGFSKGAETVKRVLIQVTNKPAYIITIGAYKTAKVDFSNHNIDFINYFDHSGIGQKSPGIFLDISHNMVQKEVNRILNRK